MFFYACCSSEIATENVFNMVFTNIEDSDHNLKFKQLIGSLHLIKEIIL